MEPMLQPGDRYPIDAVGFCNSRSRSHRPSDEGQRPGQTKWFMVEPDSPKTAPAKSLQNYTILYYTILYYTILYYTILYYTILYYTILYYTFLISSRGRMS